RSALEDLLRAEGYRVATAANGRAGLEHLRSHEPPCLVLLDLMMPVMSGGELLAAIRADDDLEELPVVIVSAWPRDAEKLRNDTQGLIKKPIDIQSLLSVVARWCDRAEP